MSVTEKATSKRWEWLEAKAYTSIVGDFDPPSHFAEAMAETVPINPGETRLLDIGCGCGIIGVYCLIKKRARLVTFNDVLSEAMAVTFANIRWHLQQGNIDESQVGAVKASFTDLPSAVAAEHDIIAFNPPQLPWTRVSEEYRKEVDANASQKSFRWGGQDGLDVARQFLDWYSAPGPRKPKALMTLSSFLGRSLIEATMNSYGIKWEILNRKSNVPLRKILTEGADRLSAPEVIDRSLRKGSDGKWTKELLVLSFEGR
jgi:hypothetical protein